LEIIEVPPCNSSTSAEPAVDRLNFGRIWPSGKTSAFPGSTCRSAKRTVYLAATNLLDERRNVGGREAAARQNLDSVSRCLDQLA
jgi:hypothetical protein